MGKNINKRRLKNKQCVHVWMTRETIQKLRDIAREQGRTVSELIREGIAHILNNYCAKQ